MVQTGVASLVRSQPDASPSEVLKTLNRVIYENIHGRLEAERHMTLSLMRYRRDGTIVVAGAHMDAVAWRSATRTVELLATPGTFIGVAEDIDRVNVETTWRIDPGDVFVLLSDGVTEAEDSQGQQFGYEAVSALVAQHATGPVQAIRDSLFEAVLRHSPVLADDATLLAMRRA